MYAPHGMHSTVSVPLPSCHHLLHALQQPERATHLKGSGQGHSRDCLRNSGSTVPFMSRRSCILGAGLYMGEIARRIILRLAEEGELFGKRVPAGLKSKRSLSTPQMARIDHDTSTDLLQTTDILQEAFGLEVDQITLEATMLVRISWSSFRSLCHRLLSRTSCRDPSGQPMRPD